MSNVEDVEYIKKDKNTICEIIGAKKELDSNILPTKGAIIKYYLWLDKCSDIFENICNKLTEIWSQTEIPIICKNSVLRKIKALYEEYRSVKKFSASSKFFTKKKSF